MFPPSITLSSNNIPYINILQTAQSHLTREGELTFYRVKFYRRHESFIGAGANDNIVSAGR